MRRTALALTVVATALAAPAALADGPAPAPVAPPKLEFLYLRLTGVEAAEAPRVAAAVGAVLGVRSFAWFAEGTEAKVVREEGKAADAALVGAARSGGAETAARVAIAVSSLLFEQKLHCGGCVKVVTKALNAVPGTKEVEVAEDLTRVRVVYDAAATTPKALEQALAACGKRGRVAP